MATDDLLDNDNAEKPEGKPAPAPQVNKADISAAVKEGLAEFGGQLGKFAEDVGSHVRNAIGTAQQKVEKGTATKQETDLVQQLLTDPEKAISAIVEKTLTAHLGPYLQTQVNDSYTSLVEKQRESVDRQWGEGAFDELIMPDLEATVKAGSPAAKASKEYVATVVRGIVGHEKVLPKLMERKSTMDAKRAADEKAREAEEGPNFILDGGRRKPGKPTLSDADRAFLNKYEEHTGTKTDHKFLESALAIRARDGSWSVDNWPGLKGKDA